MSPVRNWTLGVALIVPLMGGLSAATDHWPAATAAIATTPPAIHYVGDPADVSATVNGRSPGDHVTVVVQRDGQPVTLDVELGKRPAKQGP